VVLFVDQKSDPYGCHNRTSFKIVLYGKIILNSELLNDDANSIMLSAIFFSEPQL
jgi:hypothetical protein